MEKLLMIHEMTKTELSALLSEIISAELKQIANKKTDPPEFYSREEASKILKVSLVTLNGWTKSGLIKAHRLGGRVYYKHIEVISAMKEIKGAIRR